MKRICRDTPFYGTDLELKFLPPSTDDVKPIVHTLSAVPDLEIDKNPSPFIQPKQDMTKPRIADFTFKPLSVNHFSGNLLQLFLFILPFLFIANLSAQTIEYNLPPKVSEGFWLGAAIGPSKLVEKAPDSLSPEIHDYLNKLRSGWHYSLEGGYFFNKYMGLGAKYVHFNTKQEVDSLVVKFFTHNYYFNLSNSISINTLSPMAYGRLLLLKDRLSIVGGIGPAWVFYRNIGNTVTDSVTIKGSSPGLSTSLRITYEVIPNLHLGIQCSYTRAFLKKFTEDNGTTTKEIELAEKDYQNLSRMDYSFGVYYYFGRRRE